MRARVVFAAVFVSCAWGTLAQAQPPASGIATPEPTTSLTLDWLTEPAVAPPGKVTKDPIIETFDPAKAALSEPDICVEIPGSAQSKCATPKAGQFITLDAALFDGPSGDDDTTCRRVPEVRTGPDGKPTRIWLDVCDGDDGSQTRLRTTAITADEGPAIGGPALKGTGGLDVVLPPSGG